MIKLVPLVLCFGTLAFAQTNPPRFERYFNDTYQSLEKVRNPTSGLLPDSFTPELVVLNDATSPTNIGLDLLLQLQVSNRGHLKQMLHTLSAVEYDSASGLFFNRYFSSGKVAVHDSISSVDNLHLAYALWVLSQAAPDLSVRQMSLSIFERMNFSVLSDPATGLFVGGLYFRNGKWQKELWKYDYFGSEARTLYSIGWAIGLIKDEQFSEKSTHTLTVEMNGPILRLWDGGAFQLLLPRLLMNEEIYSERLNDSFIAYARHALDQGKLLPYPVPASFSACEVGVNEYNGKAGSPELVSSTNRDFQEPYLRERWDEVFTPHAAFLAASFFPQEFETTLLGAESLGSNRSLYVEGLGWLDGFHLKGENKGKTVPVFLTLDQEMIALSIAQINAPHHRLMGSEVLFQNRQIQERLRKYFLLLQPTLR